MIELPDLPTQKDRLQWAAKRVGATKAAALCRLVGGEESTVRSNFNGTRPFSRQAAIVYGEKLGVPWAWLLEGDRGDGFFVPEPQESVVREEATPFYAQPKATKGVVIVDELDVRANGGHGLFHEDGEPEKVVSRWQMPSAIVSAQTTTASSNLKIITVYGDSMVPDFMPGERVLVDIGDRTPSPPGVFVLFDGVGLVIKRVELISSKNESHQVRLIPRNSQYSTYDRPLSEVAINGRVIGKWLWT